MSDQAASRRVRRNGRLVRLKRPDAAGNARPRKVAIVGHGGASKTLLRDPLDLRTVVGRAYHADKQALCAHLAGDPSLPEEKLIDQAARLGILADIAWGSIHRDGLFSKQGALSPAFEAFIKATRDQRDVLRLLGIKRRAKPVPTLEQYLQGKASGVEPKEAQNVFERLPRGEKCP